MCGTTLAWCQGTKLAPFKFRHDAHRDIEFLEPIGAGLHSQVFRAKIDGQIYAVKLFRFTHHRELAPPTFFNHGLVSVDEIINNYDPFYCECRAYGRLKEVGREDLAARCYGYLLLRPDQEVELNRRGCQDFWHRRPATKGRPIRGIVKEYIPGCDVPFVFNDLPRMKRDIKALNRRLGIVNWDVREDNYRGGLLIDFSQAHTAPHMQLDFTSKLFTSASVMECCVRDQACFDNMVERWNESHPQRKFWHFFLPNAQFGINLRDKSRYRLSFYKQEGASLVAAFYDWKKNKPAKRTAAVLNQMRRIQEGRVDKATRRNAT
ncbi:kinetochore sim4 complex subunit FTA2 domain-containing protein [Hirsutella rhossiliensis]|uniref:Kinetochore sim4 complex subunit FTA2 domain-containing protein n=1 Tax=Hirsutella rhossiliensis TaxID=111463 RepID=A0A9P8SGE8_9HYPO|nr:kinetochore sim4 complex subunit FTA2 domain-containing protein [Hirsutella rhossiliensis]KAH0961054.1 kinetochore sim4 complex subunit FTA2 domain-containing protein [Hirsutella rhossiliensis]